MYLGGFYNEDQAALAYDLAAIRFRGGDAILNFDPELYDEEMDERNCFTREQIVSCLRSQSKSMNKVDSGPPSVRMADWEVALAAALQPNKVHIGVYGSEIEAARAYDRGLVQALSIDAAPLLNFQLMDYLDLLSPAHIELAIGRGLLPSVLPANFCPPNPPHPLFQLGNCNASEQNAAQGRLVPLSSTDDGQPTGQTQLYDDKMGEQNKTPSVPVPRRKSVTPRSVLDFEDATVPQPQQPMPPASSYLERVKIEEFVPSKRVRQTEKE